MSKIKLEKDMEMLVEDWFGLEKESIITNLRICVDSFLTLEILSQIFLDSCATFVLQFHQEPSQENRYKLN